MAVISISSSNDITYQSDTSNVFYPIVSQKINKALDNFKLEKKLQSAGINESMINTIKNPLIINEIKINEKNIVDLALNNAYFVEIMYGFIVPFVILLPFFLASNIVTDSAVGERKKNI